MKLSVATKAFIIYQGKVLIIGESTRYQTGTNIGKYDVPGGRVKPGQRFDQSLKREIREETGLEIKIGQPFFVNEWRPKVKGEQWSDVLSDSDQTSEQIVGTFFECQAETNKVTLSQDHDDYQWIEPKDYQKYNLIENLIPAFKAYLNKKEQVI